MRIFLSGILLGLLLIASSASLVLLALSVSSRTLLESIEKVSCPTIFSLCRGISFFVAQSLREREDSCKAEEALSVAEMIISIEFFIAIPTCILK